MQRRHTDVYVSRSERYAIGIEEVGGSFYVSFPVSNSLCDYEEFYTITAAQFAAFRANPAAALPFVNACRRHEHDDLLVYPPGSQRGIPS
ncbi:hypothetical protein [Massilia sp. CF038]|uniref:hypothetical protein n=1 Tax=Massilia sp. CF038 TaxID=1881045 RepID=UPI000913740C|nr:hypothetical protein [Massilia sp. CF038]SHH28100.1 hypothetical protein SAMN05428948_3650 [Massilia sp. CF038]